MVDERGPLRRALSKGLATGTLALGVLELTGQRGCGRRRVGGQSAKADCDRHSRARAGAAARRIRARSAAASSRAGDGGDGVKAAWTNGARDLGDSDGRIAVAIVETLSQFG